MKRVLAGLLAVVLLGAGVSAHAASALVKGKPEIRSMSALAFGPEGVLFVGDSRAGAVFAIDLADRTAREVDKPGAVQDVEGKLAALLGALPLDVLVHDMAVNPLSKNVYLAVSRGRAQLASEWQLPNDVADATVLVKIDEAQRFSVVDLASVAHARLDLPNPIDPAKTHGWKEGLSLRTETITDIAYADGALFIAGLSNEEFASTMWRAAYPFAGPVAATTIENYHGAHGKYETEAPVRAFVPYALNGKTHLVAAYLCTPLVTFDASSLVDKKHVRGRTIGEFGSGNYPLDMVVYKNKDQQKLLIANSNLPFMIVDPKDVEAYAGEISARLPGYTGGVRFESRSGTGVQQLDNLGDAHVVVLRRLMGGRLDLVPMSVRRF
jgi:hypothetical protein